jgi:hypothetical protein
LRARAGDKDVDIFLHNRVFGAKRISEIGKPIQLIRQSLSARDRARKRPGKRKWAAWHENKC